MTALVTPQLPAGPGPASAIPSRFAILLHLASLLLIAAVFAVLARGQWFFYDEWQFVDPAQSWNLLAPHNGHLSLGLVLIFSTIKSVIGLSAYWPYLAVTILLHLGIVHLVWRALNRAAVQPLIALLLSVGFGVLAVGADNTLWAFQSGFIAPIALGLAAFEVIDTGRWNVVRSIVVALLLAIGICFSSTALPFFAIAVLFLLVRRGWVSALVIGLVILIPYLGWRLMFVSGPQPTDAYAAHGVGDYLARVPEFLVTSLVNSIAATGPGPVLAAALFVAFLVWVAIDLRGRRIRQIPVPFFLLLVGLVFSLLVAMSRLRLGDDGGDAGRYVYFYVAVTVPAVGMALTWLIRDSRVVLATIGVVVLAAVSFNAVGLVVNARSQAAIEQFTKQSVSAALFLASEGEASGNQHPIPVLAPSLTIAELEALQSAGDLKAGPYSRDALLSDEVSLELQTDPLPGSPALTDCTAGSAGYVMSPGPQHQVELRAQSAQVVSVTVQLAGATSAYTQIELKPGVQQLIGFDDATITLGAPQSGALCIPQIVG